MEYCKNEKACSNSKYCIKDSDFRTECLKYGFIYKIIKKGLK